MGIRIGNQIKEARGRLLITQFELAAKARVAISSVCNAENDRPVSYRVARNLAKALDISIEELRMSTRRRPKGRNHGGSQAPLPQVA